MEDVKKLAGGSERKGTGVEGETQPGPAILTPKEQRELRKQFDLHVLLIMHQEKVTTAVAAYQAYRETPAGLQSRLARNPLATP